MLSKETLNKSFMSRVADKIAMIARRATKVVAGTTMPRSATPRARDFVATRMGTGFAGGLLCCAPCEGDRPFVSSHALHAIPQNTVRSHAGFIQCFPKIFLIGLLLLQAGCSVNAPTPIVHQPMTAKPTANKTVPPADGAIFHAGINERPLFEDKRARNIGDILTINIVEKTSADRKSSGSSSYSNAIDANIPTVTTNIPAKIGGPIGSLLSQLFSLTGNVAGASANKTSSSGAGSASEQLTGTIAVTVTEVMANGNLLVSGEKQIALNNNNEFVRFSGVVNPTSISNLNVVQSTQVADARLEYRGAGGMNEILNDVQSLGMLGRFFLSVLPF